MYRGRPPPRGGYPPPFEGRGPPRPYPAPGYRDDRSRPRPPYHPSYHDHGPPDSHRRSPSRRRYPSPSHGGEYRAGGQPRERSASPPILDHNLVITVGNELTTPAGSTPSRHHDRDYPPRPDYERSRSRGRSRPRSHSQDRSPGRSRAKSRGRSKSRPRSQSRSPDRNCAKSRGRSKSRPRSRSRSRGRSRGRSYSKADSHGRSKSRQRSRSKSRRRSSSSSSSSRSDKKCSKDFKELQMARRRKELEEMLSQPTKSILKKRSEDSPSVRSCDASMSHVAEQLLQAVKTTDPRAMASMLSELRSDPEMSQRAGLDAEIKEILSLLGVAGPAGKPLEKPADDIDDEEKFLYGDSEEPKPPAPEPVRHHSLDLYGEVTEETLYGDYPPQKAAVGPAYGRSPGASTNLQAPSPTTEVDVRYRPAVGPDHNVTVQVSNPAFPPGTEPLEESERQALEEYEKIQDLLKTIGLDLGVTEISKMAARTKERLHGSKPPPKTPMHRRRYSSGSSSGSRSGRRRRSRSSSSSSSRSRSGGWSSDDDDDRRKSSALPKAPKTPKDDSDSKAAAPPPPTAAPPPSHQGVPIPTYPPSHGLMPPNFPPPPFGQYANFLPYVPQQWPPMYPPPNMNLPHHAAEDFPTTAPFKQTYSREPGPGATGSAPDGLKGSCKSSRVSEEQNNESQKQKVLEEREKLKQEREIRMKKKEYLMKELERLRKQQGELLRKKRREKDGHKDPLLQEISHLQEEVMAQISNLRKEHEAAEKKRNEIDKVALILGVSPLDRPRRPSRLPEEDQPSTKVKREAERSPEWRGAPSSSTTKQTLVAPLPSGTPLDKPPPTTVAPPPEPFEYYDAGNHWCKNCNVTSGSMFDFFTHLHSKTHRKTLDPYDRPWVSTPNKISKSVSSEEKLTKPAKGSEFLLPVRGFFCLLCREFYGDAICAEEHVTTHAHNEKYKKQMYENPLYEQRRNLDRQAGLASEASMKKRKHDDDDDEEKGGKEEKSKHKKEKKEKEKKKEDNDGAQKEKPKTKKEEVEDRMKKVDKTLDEDKPSYSKKDEEDKYKYSKKDDKYRYREEDERGKYSRRDGDEEYRGGKEEEYRYRYRRYDNDCYDGRPKYGPRDGEDRNKYGKPHDDRFKYDREQDEGKPKAEREGFKKPEPDTPAGKLEVSKPEPPPKPYDPPKIFCGPSPAMRAKLRKQSLESGKPTPATVTTTTSFAKFTWKKKENQLAKEAAKVAAEFIKEDEAAAKEQPATAEDSFAKSMAVAKEIALKLGGLPSGPPPWASNGANRGRIRPNLPAPASVLRKTTMAGKPTPLNTFLSIRPQNMSFPGPPPKEGSLLPDPLTKALNAQDALLQSNPLPPVAKPEPFGLGPPPTASKPAPPGVQPAPPGVQPAPPGVQPAPPGVQPAPPGVQPAPPVSKPVTLESKPPPSEARPSPLVSMSAPFGIQPAPPVFRPATLESKPAPSASKLTQLMSSLAPVKVHPAPPVSKPATLDSKPAPSEVKPVPIQAATSPPAPSKDTPAQPTMIKIVSDVAAPGVPESEQTHTVFVKPPPFMNLGEGAQKSEKLKSNLAAAKAQELFDIFYNSVGDSGPSSFTKPAKDTRADSSAAKSPLPIPQAPKAQSQPRAQPLTDSHLPAEVHTPPQPDSKNSPPSPQSQTDSNIQIASVWSLQPTTDSALELATPKTSTQPEPTSPSQPEGKTSRQNRSSTPVSRETTPPTQPAEPEPAPESRPEPAPPIQTRSEPWPDHDTESQPETCPDIAPELESKPGPKTRGKKTPPAPRPARQTRSQTRYQTRQRQQQQQNRSEPEPEPVSGDSDSAGLDSKGLDTSDPGSGSHLESEAGAPSQEDPQMMEITPETLGLPSDMISLDFEYDFNFE